MTRPMADDMMDDLELKLEELKEKWKNEFYHKFPILSVDSVSITPEIADFWLERLDLYWEFIEQFDEQRAVEMVREAREKTK